jgi:hypothetical protein
VSAIDAALVSIGSDMRKLSGAASNINISAVEAVDILRTTELWDLVAGYDAEPATPPQDLPTGYITW